MDELDALNRAAGNWAQAAEEYRKLIPTDCEGMQLEIGDTVHMLRSEYNGDREWDDVIVELALCKNGGDRWIARGARGDAWACECTKTGHDEDLYERSDDETILHVPWDDTEAENRELRELVGDMHKTIDGVKLKAAREDWLPCTDSCPHWASGDCADLPDDECWYEVRMRELGIEA